MKSGHVLPSAAVHDVTDGGFCDTEATRDLGALNALLGKISYGANVLFAQLRAMVPLAKNTALFSNHVLNIVFVRAEEQMVRANANPVVTMVAYEFPVRNFSIMKFPGNSMSQQALMRRIRSNHPVATAKLSTLPFPALSGLLDSLPKALSQRLAPAARETGATTEPSARMGWDESVTTVFADTLMGRLWTHSEPPIPGAGLPAVSAARELSDVLILPYSWGT